MPEELWRVINKSWSLASSVKISHEYPREESNSMSYFTSEQHNSETLVPEARRIMWRATTCDTSRKNTSMGENKKSLHYEVIKPSRKHVFAAGMQHRDYVITSRLLHRCAQYGQSGFILPKNGIQFKQSHTLLRATPRSAPQEPATSWFVAVACGLAFSIKPTAKASPLSYHYYSSSSPSLFFSNTQLLD